MMNKLRDRRGASLLMALLLLLLATMVSVVILTAVSSAARHLSRDREAQQNYLTVSSAAELLRRSGQGFPAEPDRELSAFCRELPVALFYP